MTEAKIRWVKSTVRMMELAGYEPTSILTAAFNRYIEGQITFYEVCAVMRDEGE